MIRPDQTDLEHRLASGALADGAPKCRRLGATGQPMARRARTYRRGPRRRGRVICRLVPERRERPSRAHCAHE